MDQIILKRGLLTVKVLMQ